MDKQTETNTMLDALVLPAFLVEKGVVSRVNEAARVLLIRPGTPVEELLLTGREEYGDFTRGRLYLSLDLNGSCRSAGVSPLEGADLFILEQESQSELTALALAARQLRDPLSRVISSAEQLYDPESGPEALQLNRGLYQLLRIIGNMSDAGLSLSRQEIVNIPGEISEILEKAGALLSRAGISLTCQLLREPVYGLADRDQLERAILNLLSNAAKYLPRDGSLEAELTRKDKMLQLTLRDSGSGIGRELLPTVFTRYLREPAIEDARAGLGLGMTLVKSAAQSHGGTVLVDSPETGGCRITLTLAIRQRSEDMLRSPVLRVDRSGGRDIGLIELSEILPPELYTPAQ